MRFSRWLLVSLIGSFVCCEVLLGIVHSVGTVAGMLNVIEHVNVCLYLVNPLSMLSTPTSFSASKSELRWDYRILEFILSSWVIVASL